MKTEHAVRYLLLRHLRRHRDTVPAARFAEVTRSLGVVRAGDDWLVAWQDAGAGRSARIAAGDLVFYRRGDTQPDSRALDDSVATPNNVRAARFAAELFGTAPAPLRDEALEGRPWLGWLEDGAMAAAMLLGGQLRLALAVVALAAAERRSRLLCAALLLPVAWLAAPAIAALALVYAALQWLDPNREARGARVALAVVAALVAGARLDLHGSLLGVLAVMVAAAAVFVAQMVQRIHFRALPLAWPWLCVGLAAQGASSAAWLGLAALAAVLAAGVMARARWPLQRERTLTPNG